jgi:hypothetical protein
LGGRRGEEGGRVLISFNNFRVRLWRIKKGGNVKIKLVAK